MARSKTNADLIGATTAATVGVFKYVPELDCLVVDEAFSQISDYLGLSEWNPVVWIGRLFALDNDFGEHWFDNWGLREALAERAQALGYDSSELLVIDPARFQHGRNGPCHSADLRRRFWTDVLRSLTLSLDLLADEARELSSLRRENEPDAYMTDLENRISEVLSGKFQDGRPREADTAP